MVRLQTQPNKTPQTLFNPDREAFIFSYDGGKEVYTLYPMSYEEFPKYIADKMASALADKIISKAGLKHTTDKEELLKRIYV